MLGILLLIGSSFGEQSAIRIGKQALRDNIESNFGMGFLMLAWSAVVFLITIIFGASFEFNLACWPFFAMRFIAEILLTYFTVRAVATANLSTLGFLNLLSIPALLIIDLSLGYNIKAAQIAGIVLILISLTVLLFHNPQGKHGASLILLSVLFTVITTTLFKYDISHFNSVAAEQLIICTMLAIFFFSTAKFISHERPLKMLVGRVTGFQAILSGLSLVLNAFALGLLPPSILIALKRGLGTLWSIIFGHKYFMEEAFTQKLIALTIVVLGIALAA